MATSKRSVRAPPRDVLHIVEVEGERGGIQLVHVLTCGHWIVRRKATTSVRCIGCAIDLYLSSLPPKGD